MALATFQVLNSHMRSVAHGGQSRYRTFQHGRELYQTEFSALASGVPPAPALCEFMPDLCGERVVGLGRKKVSTLLLHKLEHH